MAINCQRPQNDLIFHSYRGVQYASFGYRELLTEYNITQSMSRKKGEPYDNAVAENLRILKFIYIYLCVFFPTTQNEKLIDLLQPPSRYLHTIYSHFIPIIFFYLTKEISAACAMSICFINFAPCFLNSYSDKHIDHILFAF